MDSCGRGKRLTRMMLTRRRAAKRGSGGRNCWEAGNKRSTETSREDGGAVRGVPGPLFFFFFEASVWAFGAQHAAPLQGISCGHFFDCERKRGSELPA